ADAGLQPPTDAGVEPTSTFAVLPLEREGYVVRTAEVSLGGSTRDTQGGLAVFEDVAAGRRVVRATAPGFAPWAASLDVPAGIRAGAAALFERQRPAVPFDPSKALWLDFGQVRIQVPADAVVTGATPALVQARLTFIDLTRDAAFAPGFLQAENAGAIVPLEPLAVAHLELRTDAGAAPLKAGTTLQVQFEVPASSGSDGQTIPVWRFDAADGLWKKGSEGALKTEAGRKLWSGTVAETGWFAAGAIASQLTCVEVSARHDGQPVKGAFVLAEGADWAGVAAAVTGEDGKARLQLRGGRHARVNVVAEGLFAGLAQDFEVQAPSPDCQPVAVTLSPPACLRGKVEHDGAGVGGADVAGFYPGSAPLAAVSSSSGEWCAPVPRGAPVELIARKVQPGGRVDTAWI
ncbi:MAG: hypothetical protein ACK4N5_24005, partial [Myxococcales bacterium]